MVMLMVDGGPGSGKTTIVNEVINLFDASRNSEEISFFEIELFD